MSLAVSTSLGHVDSVAYDSDSALAESAGAVYPSTQYGALSARNVVR